MYFVYRNFEVGFIDVIALGDHVESIAGTTFQDIDPMDFDTSWG